MITVYRVEDSKAEGPYINTAIFLRPQWMGEHNYSDAHPAPYRDLIRTKNFDNYHFGFESLKALKAWFSDECWEWLSAKHFHIVEYKADEYEMLAGKYQCAFKCDTAEFVREISL